MVLAGLVAALPAFAQQGAAASDAAQANNPLANMTAFNIQDYYIGKLTESDNSANQFWLRYAKPFSVAHTNWLLRASLPVNTYPTGSNGDKQTGFGDLNVFAAYLIAHPIMVLVLALGSRWMLRVTTVPKAALFPIVLVLCVVGAYALNNTMANVYVLLSFGLLGYAMVKFGYPLAPFILGVILGDQIEINLIRAIMTDANPWLFLTRPISGGLIALAAASLAFSVWQHYRHRARSVAAETDADF